MKIDERMRFPHPVLWERTGDYRGGELSVDLKIDETFATGQLTLQYSVRLEEMAVRALLEQRKAAMGLFVTCLETYYNMLIPALHTGGVTQVSSGYLKGRVIIRPMVWAVEDVTGFSSATLHPEFGTSPLSLDRSAILALGDEHVISVGSEKLLPMESIFALGRDDAVPAGEFRVQLDDENIRLLAEKGTFERIHLLRGTTDGKARLLNGVYLPAVMEVLASLQEDGDRYEGKRWHRVFMAKLDHLNIKLESGGILENAQRLLKSPFGRITEGMAL